MSYDILSEILLLFDINGRPDSEEIFLNVCEYPLWTNSFLTHAMITMMPYITK